MYLLDRKEEDLGSHGGGEKGLSECDDTETSRPGLISTVRPDLPSQLIGLNQRDTLGVIRLGSIVTQGLPSLSGRQSPPQSQRCTAPSEGGALCSARHETANVSLRTWKVCQCSRICMVTLCSSVLRRDGGHVGVVLSPHMVS